MHLLFLEYDVVCCKGSTVSDSIKKGLAFVLLVLVFLVLVLMVLVPVVRVHVILVLIALVLG